MKTGYNQIGIYKNKDGTVTSYGYVNMDKLKCFIQKVWSDNVNFKIVAVFKFKNPFK